MLFVLLLCRGSGIRAEAQEKDTCFPPVDARFASYSCQKLLDHELARVYSEIAARIRPGLPGLLRDDQLPKQKQMFIDAQRAWEVFRAKTCEADAFENHDTSGYSAALAGCRITLTRARIEQLRSGRWGVLLGEAARAESVDRARADSPLPLIGRPRPAHGGAGVMPLPRASAAQRNRKWLRSVSASRGGERFPGCPAVPYRDD